MLLPARLPPPALSSPSNLSPTHLRLGSFFRPIGPERAPRAETPSPRQATKPVIFPRSPHQGAGWNSGEQIKAEARQRRRRSALRTQEEGEETRILHIKERERGGERERRIKRAERHCRFLSFLIGPKKEKGIDSSCRDPSSRSCHFLSPRVAPPHPPPLSLVPPQRPLLPRHYETTGVAPTLFPLRQGTLLPGV